MANSLIAFYQVLIMFIIAACGFILVKLKLLDVSCVKSLTNILLYLVTPSVVLSATNRAYDASEAGGFLAALGLSVIIYIVSLVLVSLLIRRKSNSNAGVERFAAAMSNTGYIGIPMANALLGMDGVFFITANIIVFNLCMFSYGRIQLSRDHDLKLGQELTKLKLDKSFLPCLINPATISAAIGLTVYFTHNQLPAIISSVVNSFYPINTALSMLVLGILLAQEKVLSILTNMRCVLISFFRLIALPLVALVILYFIDISWLTQSHQMVKAAILIGVSGPSAVATSFSAVLYGADSVYASKLVAHSTLFSIITMPLIFYIWEALPGFLG